MKPEQTLEIEGRSIQSLLCITQGMEATHTNDSLEWDNDAKVMVEVVAAVVANVCPRHRHVRFPCQIHMDRCFVCLSVVPPTESKMTSGHMIDYTLEQDDVQRHKHTHTHTHP